MCLQLKCSLKFYHKHFVFLYVSYKLVHKNAFYKKNITQTSRSHCIEHWSPKHLSMRNQLRWTELHWVKKKIQSGKRTIFSFMIVFGCHILHVSNMNGFFVFSKRLFRCSLYLSNITLSTGAFEVVDYDVALQFMNCLTGNFLPLCGKVKKLIVIVVNIKFCYTGCICHICSFPSDDSAIRICHCLLTISLSCWSLWLNSVMKVILFVFQIGVSVFSTSDLDYIKV